MSTEAVVSLTLRIKDIIDGSVRVGSRPLGGGSGGNTRRPWRWWAGGIGTSLEQYIPSASTSQLVPEDKEAERSTTRRASHLPRRREERKRVSRSEEVSELRRGSLRM